MVKKNNEICILGAGISGLASAIILADLFTVNVYEKSAELGQGHSHISAMRNYEGDITQKTAKMGIGLEPSKEIHTVHRYAPSGKKSTVSSNKPIFYMFNRGKTQDSIEQQLYKQALNKGASVNFNAKKNRGDIIATGPIRERANIFGYGRIYKGEIDAISLIYNNDFTPKGYICILPSKTDFQILAVSFQKTTFKRLESRFEKALIKSLILRTIVEEHPAIMEVKGYGNYFKPIGYKNEAYYVGEAGGFQDPSRGFGMWCAILTGYLAAKSIIENGDYNEKLRQSIMEEYQVNLKRRQNFDNLTNRDFEEMIAKLGKEVNLRTYLERRV